MKIPFVDLKTQYLNCKDEIDSAIANVIRDTAFIQGKYVEEFEVNFALFCQALHCIGVGNGTDALFIALKAYSIGKGDEVIVPANSFIATAEAVTMTGAKVVFADIEAKTFNINPEEITRKITNRTKAVIPVHLYGQPADMPSICKIAERYSIKIIQDCAQAHGADINGTQLIKFGDTLSYSFYPGKNLGAYGDAGAVVTNNKNVSKFVKMYANHGRIAKYKHDFEGINSRMDGLQAAILSVKLKYLNEWTERRREIASFYGKSLRKYERIKLPYVKLGYKHVYHLYVIRTEDKEELQIYLNSNGIQTGIHYPIALPFLKAYKYLNHKNEDFPIAHKSQNELLSLPIYPELTVEQQNYVVDKIKDFYRK